jgi:polyprenyl-phospho-N-acetylgalactosaminyl synthase
VEPIRLGEADVVFGSRFLRVSDRAAVPFARRWLLRGAVVVNGLLTGAWLSDAHNGLRAFSGRAAARIRLHESGFAYASELLEQIGPLGLHLREVPVTVSYTEYSRGKGQSGWNAFNIVIDYLARKVLG